jgi:hypothetical protein
MLVKELIEELSHLLPNSEIIVRAQDPIRLGSFTEQAIREIDLVPVYDPDDYCCEECQRSDPKTYAVIVASIDQ